MDIRARTGARALSPDAAGDVARIQELWGDLRERYGAGGPFLFGRRTIADAFYAPVCTRFVTYDVTLDPVCAAYVEALLADPAVTAWGEAAAAEPWTIAAP
jgi:glutathione S-transferase